MKEKKVERLYLLIKRIHAYVHTVMISSCFYKTGHKISIMPPFRFSYLNCVEIGNYVTIHPNCWIQSVKSDSRLKLSIGDFTSIGMNSVISAAHSIVIKNHVMIGPKVFISDHNHQFLDINVPILKQGLGKILDVKINEGSWIGYGVAILPGAIIGRNCIIGANSVVNSVIPDYSIAVGSPAIVIRRYDEKTQRWEKV
jgi:acetyltransferase-like isoleucine patch superfamily enzyme